MFIPYGWWGVESPTAMPVERGPLGPNLVRLYAAQGCPADNQGRVAGQSSGSVKGSHRSWTA
jgi:hypothetical protein